MSLRHEQRGHFVMELFAVLITALVTIAHLL